MTWTLVTNKTQKIIHCLSIWSALDPNLRNLSLNPLNTTDIKMLDYPFDVDFDTKYEGDDASEPHKTVCLRDHGVENQTSDDLEDQIGDKFKLVITDKNGEAKKDAKSNVMY